MIERFCKKLDCTASHGLNTHPSVPMSRNKNNGNVAFLFFQLGLQLQTRHPWHAAVHDQARGFAMQIGFEELLRGSEAPCRKPRRLQKVAQRILHGLIVINDRNQFGRLLQLHARRVARLHITEQSNFRRTKLDFSRLEPYFRWIEIRHRQAETETVYQDLSLSAILTNSGKDLACIFFMTWLRYILMVASLAPSSAATCLLSIPETTRFITSRSRTLSCSWRCCSSANCCSFSRRMRDRVRDRWTASSRSCCLNGFVRNSTAPDFIAFTDIGTSAWAERKIMGILILPFFSSC